MTEPSCTPELLLMLCRRVFPMRKPATPDVILWVDPRRSGYIPADGFVSRAVFARRMRRQPPCVTIIRLWGRCSWTPARDLATRHGSTRRNAVFILICTDGHPPRVCEGLGRCALAGPGVTEDHTGGAVFLQRNMFSRRTMRQRCFALSGGRLQNGRGFTVRRHGF